MFAESLTKEAAGYYMPPQRQAIQNYGSSYQSPYSQGGQAPGQAGGISNSTAAFATLANLLSMKNAPKRQNNLYDYAMKNPDHLGSHGMEDQFKEARPERYAQAQAARKDLERASGHGWGFRHRMRKSMSPQLMRDAILLEPRMDKKMAMLAALKREPGTAAKAAIKMVTGAKGLIDPSRKEKFWSTEPGKASVGANIDSIWGAKNENISGSPQYTGTIRGRISGYANKLGRSVRSSSVYNGLQPAPRAGTPAPTSNNLANNWFNRLMPAPTNPSAQAVMQ